MKSEEKWQLAEILEKYTNAQSPLKETYSFVREFLDPQQGDYYWTYRYEHSLRVALWGKRIAEGEGWDSEPLVMACLLHDIGYPECRTVADFDKHAVVSAEVAEKFLKRIQYDTFLSNSICNAIAIHDRWSDVPTDATPFELSVRDADDLDRFDMMRLCLSGAKDIGERSASDLIDICEERLNSLIDWENRICGTTTAKMFWEDELRIRRQLYESVKSQMQGSVDMEMILKQEG